MRAQSAILGGVILFSAVTIAASSAIDDTKAVAILTKSGCVMCHTVDKKLVGPSYKEVAAKYKANKDAPALLAKKIREGGQGVYGPVPMPPNPATKITDEDVKALVEWVLTK